MPRISPDWEPYDGAWSAEMTFAAVSLSEWLDTILDSTLMLIFARACKNAESFAPTADEPPWLFVRNASFFAAVSDCAGPAWCFDNTVMAALSDSTFSDES